MAVSKARVIFSPAAHPIPPIINWDAKINTAQGIPSVPPHRFVPFRQRYGLTETDHLYTVWGTFSPETPGKCRRIAIGGVDAYATAERLKKKGLYQAKTIEDPGGIFFWRKPSPAAGNSPCVADRLLFGGPTGRRYLSATPT